MLKLNGDGPLDLHVHLSNFDTMTKLILWLSGLDGMALERKSQAKQKQPFDVFEYEINGNNLNHS